MECAVRIRIDSKFDALAHSHFADVGFINQKFDAHGRQVCHRYDDHLAGKALRNGLPFFHRFADDHAIHWRSDDRVIDIRLGFVVSGQCILVIHAGIVHVLVGDGTLLIQLIQSSVVRFLICQRVLGLLHGRSQRFGLDGGQHLALGDLLILLHIHLFQSARSGGRQIDAIHRFDSAGGVNGESDRIFGYFSQSVALLRFLMTLLIPEIPASYGDEYHNDYGYDGFFPHIIASLK